MLLSYIALGFQFALSAMIGFELGKQKVAKAKWIAIQGSLTCYTYIIIIIILQIIFSHELIEFFTNDPEVLEIGQKSLVVLSIVFLFDSI